MWRYITLTSLFFFLIGILLWYFQPWKKNITSQKILLENTMDYTFPGLVLIDIDDTLTTGNDNENVVQTVLNRGWAVGICTANSSYTMDNIKNRSWMPKNLWNFIRKHNDITFNNVGSGFLMGKNQMAVYKRLYTQTPSGTDVYGFRKGFALEQTGKALGIKNPKCMILCDDLTPFIQAVKKYNPNLVTICSGTDCGGQLNVNNVEKAMESCNSK